MDKHITYLLPSKNRPSKFNDCLTDIFTLSVSNNYEVIAVLNEDDKDLENYKSIIKEFSGMRVGLILSLIKTKIEACNVAVPLIKTETDIVVLYSDDFRLLKKGFDNDIREAYADGFKGVVHFPDGRHNHIPQKTLCCQFLEWALNKGWQRQPTGKWNKPQQPGGRFWQYENFTTPMLYDMFELELKMRLVTFPIYHKSYLDRFGYFYHSDYKSVMCDQEMTDVAKQLGMYKFVDKPIMEHQHYRFGFDGGLPDELYKHNDSGEMYQHDRGVYSNRAEINFGLE